MMNILILGSGGREHAIAWRLGLSQSCQSIFLCPGNAGTLKSGIKTLQVQNASDLDEIINEAKSQKIELIVIGPEGLLADGWANTLRDAGFLVCGPCVEGAKLEASKSFAKHFMKSANIPTAAFRVVSSFETFKTEIQTQAQWPLVVKLDGLAAGKGVAVAQNKDEAAAFGERIWNNQDFGPGPHDVLLEEFLPGKEISYIVVTDGNTFVPMASATDYKRVHDGDEGPNTGGMGCLSPSPFLDPELEAKIQSQVVQPALNELQKRGINFRGVLYCGLMIQDGKPSVVEFNTRFGDPETQVTLLRLEGDFAQLLRHVALGKLDEAPAIHWTPNHAVFLVGAAEGYPDSPVKGDPISGLDHITETLFYAGVAKKNDEIITSGGRVLGVGALGNDLEQARTKAYEQIQRICWRGIHYRKDIGAL